MDGGACKRCGKVRPYRWLGGFHCPETMDERAQRLEDQMWELAQSLGGFRRD